MDRALGPDRDRAEVRCQATPIERAVGPADAELQDLRNEVEHLREELRTSRAEEELLMSAIRGLRGELERADAAARELSSCRTTLEALIARMASLETSLQPARERIEPEAAMPATAVATPLDAAAFPVPAGRNGDRDVPAALPVSAAAEESKAVHREDIALKLRGPASYPPSDARSGTTGEIFLFDVGPAAADLLRDLAVCGFRVIGVRTDPILGIDLDGRTVRGAAVNLAIPPVWGAIRRMCSNGAVSPPLFAYSQPANSAHALWLGRVHFAIPSEEGHELSRVFQSWLPRPRRALAYSSDVELISHIRTELQGMHMSVAVVLESRQLLEMAPAVRPEVVLVHVSAGCASALRTIAELRNLEISRDVPLLLLLDRAARPADLPLFTDEICRLGLRGRLSSEELVRLCAQCIAPLCPRPTASSRSAARTDRRSAG